MPIILIAGLLFLAALYLMTTYNTFKTLETRMDASVQEIGNQLKRQASLIPNLEASVKGYMKHEKGIFKDLTDARKTVEKAEVGNGKSLDVLESKLHSLIPKLQVLVESNPEIKASGVVTGLMEELRDTADKLMYSRRVVIDISQQYNQMLVTVPSNFVGNMFGFKKMTGISMPAGAGEATSVSMEETKDVKVNL
jgi:LemA protein